MSLDRCTIFGVEFEPVPNAPYLHDYVAICRDVQGTRNELSAYADLIREDLWFLTYFVLGIRISNHPFWVRAAREVQEGPDTNTLDAWAREHGKTSIVTTAEPIQRLMRDPERRIGIFSYSKPSAKSILRGIKHVFEHSEILKACFPDVCYKDPPKEAWKWSEDEGLYLKRKGHYREASVEANGLIEGMPTGKHYTDMYFDDIMTADIGESPEQNWKLKEMFDLALNLGTADGRHRTIGTPYHHDDVIIYISEKVDPISNRKVYHTRKKPATVDGTFNGKSVYLPEKRLAMLRANEQKFRAQQLIDPTPTESMKLDPRLLDIVSLPKIPKNLFKFMVVDPAGMKKGKKARDDSWAIGIVGVVPFRDDIGASDVYLLDLVISKMGEVEAMKTIVDMYLRAGRVLKVGVEKVGLSTMEIHIANALRAKGKVISIESKTLEILEPAGRSKEKRIESSLGWALGNGKVHISDQILPLYLDRLKTEMEKFPYWHDDGIDMFAYAWDLLKTYRFGPKPPESEDRQEKRDAWDQAFEEKETSSLSWMSH